MNATKTHLSLTHIALSTFLALTLAAALPLNGAEVIVDNSSAGFSVLSGTWSTGTATGMYGTNYRYCKTATTGSAQVQWQPAIPIAGDYEVFVWYPAAGNRPTDARYTVCYNGGYQTFTVNQTQRGGQWVSLGTFNFPAGATPNGRVTLSNLSTAKNKYVAADAVRFYMPEQVDLMMDASPVGAGSTAPAIGGPYLFMQGEVVNIEAAPAAGYAFVQWMVSAGSPVADPNSAVTTVTMDQSKTVTAVFAPAPPQFRAFWADAFHYGMQTAAQVDEMINMALQGNYNAIFAEVLAYHDNSVGSHGAYWRSSIVPRSSYVTPSFDPLAYMLQQAHANGLELHCWLVAFRMSTAWPPAGNAYLSAHPELMMVPRASMGGGPAPVGADYVLDPGSPEAQEYLAAIVRELVTNYAIDGINWDYIRYTQTDAGYPADSSYAKSGLKRFQQITGRSDVPPATGDAQWNDFRRRTIDEVVRRVRAEVASIATNPRQPLRYTADLITWGDAPGNFANSSAYGLFSNWELWLRMGWLDGGCPMAYDREYNSSQAQWYRNWVNACIGWRYDRHMFIGQANYLNTMAGSVTQLDYAYGQGADGTVNYSYWVTVDANMDGTGEHDANWYPYVGSNLFTSPAPTPAMPWRSPATASEGTLWGQVTRAGVPVDNATVQVGALPTVQTDGDGYYVVTLIPASGAGTSYDVTATDGGGSATHTGVTVVAGDLRREDIALGP